MNTKYFLNTVAGNIFNTKTTPPIPTAYYVGLSTSNPTTTVTEPSGGAYARVLLNNLSEPVNGVVKNASDVAFQEATASWGTVTHYVIYDAAVGGNLLMHGALTRQRIVDINTVIVIRTGQMTLTVTGSEI